MSFFEELKRRNVFRVGIAYVLLGWVVLQAADFALDLIDAPNWIIQALFIIGLAGLPIALFFAWAFELTPEGIKREADVDRSGSLTPTTGRKLDKAIIAFLGVAVVLLLGDRLLGDRSAPVAEPAVTASEEPAPAPEPEAVAEKSIAVLPFVNMSPDPDQVFFSDGISEEILNSLAKLDALKVAGRTSSFAFRDRDDDLRQIGSTLGVEHILEGSVRKAGDRVRITAQLVKADDGFHLWSETYDRQLDDIFAIQDDIANRILAALKTALEVDSDRLSGLDVATYDKYLLGRQLMRERREEPLLRAARLFDDVNRQAPEFADAWALHGTVYLLLGNDVNSYGSIPMPEARVEARTRIDRALEIDPDNPFALAAMGLVYSEAGNDQRAIPYLERALAENPGMSNASNWLWRSYFLTGRYREASPVIARLIKTDPLFLPGVRNLRWDLMTRNDVEGMAAHLAALKAQEGSFDAITLVGAEQTLAEMEGRYADAIALSAAERFGGLAAVFDTSMLFSLGAYEQAAEAARGLPVEIVALGRLDQPEAAEQRAQQLLPSGLGVPQYLELLVSTGRYAKAVTFFDERWRSLAAFEENNPQFGLRFGWTLGRLAEALAATGDRARSTQFLNRFQAVMEKSEAEGADGRWFLASKAYLAALEGDRAKTLRSLRAFVDQGHMLAPDFTDHMKPFAALRGQAEFDELQRTMNERVNAERAKLGLGPFDFGA